MKAGDEILFGKYSGTEVKIDGEEHLILREDDILGVIERLSAGRQQRNLRRDTHGSQRNHLQRVRPQHDPRGVNTLADAVKVTLGPRGRNVVIEKTLGSPTVTKDGVTVAKEIELENKFENMGAQMVKEVASKTCDIAGDGTTTATVLAQAIFREGSKLVAAGHNPMELKRGIDKAVEADRRVTSKQLGEADQGREGDRAGRHDLRQRRRRRSARSSPRRWRRSARRA